MPTTKPFPHPEAAQIIAQIRKRFAASMLTGAQKIAYSPVEYEKDVRELLMRLFPYGVLSGLRLFNVQNRLERDFGFEMDNIVHLRHGGTDFIVVIEAKKQEIEVKGSNWLSTYNSGKKCVRSQVEWHVKTLWEYLEPISRDIDLKFVAIVASASDQTPTAAGTGHRNSELHLCSITALPDFLAKRFHFSPSATQTAPEVLRVSQSSFLDLLRLSLPVPELGHPEIASAIRYVERCRRTLDESLFQDFDPKAERWAINGSAGMGKSVLLAYAAAVLCSGHELYTFQGDTGVKKAGETFARIGFQTDAKQGGVCIMAMSARQLENIHSWFDLFVGKFQQGDEAGDVRFRQPEFVLCRDIATVTAAAKRCRALLVDEAHDIPAYAAREIAIAHEKKKFYLVVACDRHQRLRLAGSDARIIEGVDFTNKSRRLKQIYRNPAPVYIASLALMFRWFAEVGPKVLPSATELQSHFGFDAAENADQGYDLTIRSDAHPANSWCHTVAQFPNAKAAFAALVREHVGRREVLWVRFCEEDPDFDYETVSNHFNYHNCRIQDAHKISDKYVKGQDYPVVVIEGFPSFMDRYAAANDNSSHEDKMWAFRRELYLCASRATCFLYFICNVGETVGENADLRRIKEEISRLVDAVAVPSNATAGGVRQWSLFVRLTPERRKLDVFADIVPIIVETDAIPIPVVPPVVPTTPGPTISEHRISGPTEPLVARVTPIEKKSLNFEHPITVADLAAAIGVKPFQVVKDLMDIGVFANQKQLIEADVAATICKGRGFAASGKSSAIKSPSPTVTAEAAMSQPQQAIAENPPAPGEAAFGLIASTPPAPKRDGVDLISRNSPSASTSTRRPEPSKLVRLPGKDVTRPMSVMGFARELGVRHREVINSLARRGIYATGSYLLDFAAMHALAAEFCPRY